jgi:hypothetical protein
MGHCFEVLSGRITNQATLTTVTNATGDTTSVRSFAFTSKAHLYNMWGLGATAGVLRVLSPRMHDNVQNLRMPVVAASPRPMLPEWFDQPLYPQDVLTVAMSGGGAETDCESLLVYYEDLPGVSARIYTWETIKPLIKNVLSIENTVNTGGTAGDYGGSQAINTTFDLLKANTDYAILGYMLSRQICTLGIKSPDFGNLRVGGPGHLQADETRDWFVRMAQETGLPFIPVFNAANKGSTLVDYLDTATATSTTANIIVAELSQNIPA